MGYVVIPLVVSIVLAVHHLLLSDASRKSKLLVAVAVAISLVVWGYYPRWIVIATLIQVCASVYMLVYLKTEEGIGR